VSKADKRERQRQNRELAKIERERLMKRDRRMRSARGLLFVLVPVIAVFVIFSLVRSDNSSSSSTTQNGCVKVTSKKLPTKDTAQKAPAMTIDPAKTYTAKIATSCGPMTVALDAKTAPISTNNFVSLARSGFYDGLPFHRAAKDFVIQGGDPKGDGSGGPGYSVTGEVPTDHYPVGSLAAAKTGGAPAGDFGSQFFIVTGQQGATLPNDYTRFGSVTKGLDVAKKIASFAPSTGDGAPTQRVLIDSITITES
jgi:cyclophilin family peptidyl-prolyl cis-trans isomerase